MQIKTPLPAAELATVLGISKTQIGALAADGVLPRAGRGRFDLVGSVKAFVRYKVAAATAGDPTAKSLMAARARLTQAKASTAEAELKRESGDWVHVEEIERAWLALAATFRTRCLAIPTKAATRWAASRTANEAEALLRVEIHAALAELSKRGSADST